jgi:hypothetical protein
MKTLKFFISAIAIIAITCGYCSAQTIHKEATCHFDDYDAGPPIGVINGTVTYHFIIRLSKETGKIENLHWVAKECSITDEYGKAVKSIDAGHDGTGELWDFFNNPNYWNEFYGTPSITYPEITDGWWDDYMPSSLPDEGTFVSMAFKLLCKGKMIKMYCLAQLHVNANDDVTVNFIKWYIYDI